MTHLLPFMPLNSLLWVLPFCGLLLSLAILPAFVPRLWHHRAGVIVGLWATTALVPLAAVCGPRVMLSAVAHTALHDYLPFGVLCWTLYKLSTGVHVSIGFAGSPLSNAVFLLLGGMLASIMGTTGASMLLIRPFLAMNAGRFHQKHLIVFFIMIVANVGGILTPIGDPPLFLGYLNGVDFFWITRHAIGPFSVLCAGLLVAFIIIDAYYSRREAWPPSHQRTHQWSLQGYAHFIGLVGVVVIAVAAGQWAKSSPQLNLPWHDTLSWASLARDFGFISVVMLVGLWDRITKSAFNSQPKPSIAPLVEVLVLFAGIFSTLIPVFILIHRGADGPFQNLFTFLFDTMQQPNNAVFFWATGLLSAFLDNAPTYLVFFNLAGGDAQVLMETWPRTLLAISCGAVFMGALTYIGNAPNLMVQSMARSLGVTTPSFWGYTAAAGCIMVPVLGAIGYIFF